MKFIYFQLAVKLSNMKLYNSCYSIFLSYTQTGLVSVTSPKENVINSMIPIEISHIGTINSLGIIILLSLCLLTYYLVKKLHRIFCRNKIKPAMRISHKNLPQNIFCKWKQLLKHIKFAYNDSCLKVSREKVKKMIPAHTKEITHEDLQKVATLPIILPTGSQYNNPQTAEIKLSLVKVSLYSCEEQTQDIEEPPCYLIDIKIDITKVELPMFNTYKFKINLQLLITCPPVRKEQALPHSNPLITSPAKEENKEDLVFMQKVNNLLEKNLTTEKYTIKQLNIDMTMSRTSFYNRIKDMTGMSPSAYIFSFKMKEAKNLLANPQYNVTDITFLLGYTDAKYFGKKFKEYYHMCPTQYRKEMMNKL